MPNQSGRPQYKPTSDRRVGSTKLLYRTVNKLRKQLRGRPRSPTLDDRILVASLRLLAAHGYDGLTMDKVAKIAHTTKTTVYRRFNNKAQLAGAAIAHLGEQIARDRHSRAPDAARAVTNFRNTAVDHRIVGVLAAVILAKRPHPEFAAEFAKRVLGPHLASLRGELHRLGLRSNVELVTMQAIGYSVIEAVSGENAT